MSISERIRSHTSITSKSKRNLFDEIFTSCLLMERLHLYSNHIRKLEHLDANLALRELHLQDNQIKRVENLSRLVNLQVLALSGNPLDSLDSLAEVS